MEKLKMIPKSVKEIVKTLEKEGILVPEEFQQEILKHAEVYSESHIPSLTVIEAIIRTCNFWKTCVLNETEFSKLVTSRIYSMTRIGTAVIRSNRIEGSNSYIGDICKIKDEKCLPEHIVTIVTRIGDCKIQKGFGNPLKEF